MSSPSTNPNPYSPPATTLETAGLVLDHLAGGIEDFKKAINGLATRIKGERKKAWDEEMGIKPEVEEEQKKREPRRKVVEAGEDMV